MAQQLSTYQLYGKFVPTYFKREPNEVLNLLREDEIADVVKAGRMRTAVYVSRNLLAVEARGDLLQLPDWLRVAFVAEESPAVPRECDRLTPELWEVIRDKTFAVLDGDAPADTKAALEWRLGVLYRLGSWYGAILPGQ